jgi:hypothetical protein
LKDLILNDTPRYERAGVSPSMRIRRGEAAQGSGDEEINFDGPRLTACGFEPAFDI